MGCEGCCCTVFDVAKVLHADLCGFLGFYCGGDVKECFAHFGAILGYTYRFVLSFIWVGGLVRISSISSTAKYSSIEILAVRQL
jgi:hypothetical protein